MKRHEFDQEGLKQLYEDSCTLIMPYFYLEGMKRKKIDTAEAKADLKKGMDGLKLVLKQSNSWPTHWMLGKCFQVLGEHEDAYEHFLAAHKIALSDQDVMRELCLECLRTKRFKEAVYYAETAQKFAPDDFTLWTNIAACYLFLEKFDEAEKWAKKTLEKVADPNASDILRVVQDVREGKRIPPLDVNAIIIESE